MAQQSHDALAGAAIDRLAACGDARFKQVMTALVGHLHGFIRDVDLRPEEWQAAIEFLTATGQACSATRQEFVLLSDTLGASMQVVALDQARSAGHALGSTPATEATLPGPCYQAGAPELPLGSDIGEGVRGDPALYCGRVTDIDGHPLADARLDVWSADGEGDYDLPPAGPSQRLARGRFRTDAEGRYWFWSIKPGPYAVPTDGPVGRLLERLAHAPHRPGQIHLKVAAPGHAEVTTNLFVADGPCLDAGAVFGVRDSLTVEFDRHEPGVAMDGRPMHRPYWSANHDFRLLPARG